MIDVTVEDYVEFIKWAGDKLVRDVAMMCDPPAESFNDFSDGSMWPESIAACAMLETERPGVTEDPRPKDQRPTSWWRTGTRIRFDWLDRWMRG